MIRLIFPVVKLMEERHQIRILMLLLCRYSQKRLVIGLWWYRYLWHYR